MGPKAFAPGRAGVTSGRSAAHRRTALQRTGIVAGIAIVVFVVRTMVPAAGEIGVGFLFVVPSTLAGWWFGRRLGLLAAAVCIGLYVVSAAIVEDQRPPAIVVRAAVISAGAVVGSKLRERTAAQWIAESELDAIRQALTPPALPAVPGLDLAVEFVPAEHGLSGDFYLVTNGPGGTNVAIVADVCGHGPRSAKLAVFARATMASLAASCSDPAELLGMVNTTLVERWGGDTDYLTVSCVVHDPATGTVRWATAGHPPPLRLSDASELVSRGVPLGLFADAEYSTMTAPLAPPEGLLLYTDGLVDARQGSDRFGVERVRAELRAVGTGAAHEVAGAVRDAVRRFAGDGVPDDICILVLRATPVPGSAA